MDAIDQLFTLAEISIALAGFAGIIASFQFRQDSHFSRGKIISLAIIVYVSLGGAFFAAFPILLFNFGLSEEDVWKWSSLLIGINQLLITIFVWKNSPIAEWTSINRFLFITLFALSSFLAICNLMNAAGILFDKSFGIFFAIYMFNLGIVCLNFAKLLMTPLWRTLKDN